MRIPLPSRSLKRLSPACLAIALSLPLPVPADSQLSVPATVEATIAAAASSRTANSQLASMSVAGEGSIVLAQLAAAGLEIVTQPRSQTAVLGSEVTLCITASGGAPISYLWLRNGLPLTGADQSCLTLTDVTASDEGSYSVIVSDGKTSEWSDEAQLTIVPVGATPSIKSHPSSQLVTTGGTATLSVVAESTEPMQYQWYTGQSGDKNSPVTGATGATFTTPALTDTRVFWVQVTTTAGTADSKSATIMIVSPAAPQITQQPASQTVLYGGAATLTVSATGDAPLSYVWYAGQTGDKRSRVMGPSANNSFPVAVLTATTAYWVEVTNSVGVAASQTATLSVIACEYGVLHAFGFSDASAVNPRSPVIEASDGMLYGTTTMGGSLAHGTVFRMNKDGTEFAVLKGFEGSDGSSPRAALMEGRDGSLYGTTAYGGWGNAGTVFKLNKDGTGYQVIKRFTPYGGRRLGETPDGVAPLAALIEGIDGSLYGTTSEGGGGGSGTVFKLNKDGSGYQILVHFKYRNGSSVANDGERPVAPLLEGIDGALYGTTQGGGVGSRGTIFKLNKDGTEYRTLKSLSSDGAEGSGPCEAIIEGSDGALYGGAWSPFYPSVMFRLNKDGTGYTVLKRWSLDEPSPASGPLLKAKDGGFYGATLRGTNVMQQWGALFWVNSDGSGFKVLTSISLEGDRGQVEYGVWLAQGIDGELYGTTSDGGNANRGTVFSLNQDGSGFRVLRELSLNTTDGRGPSAEVIEGRDGALYGTTRHGGSANSGTIYGIDKDGSNYRLLWSFENGRDGGNPTAAVLEASDGLLYGTARNGGFGDNGTLFRINRNGNGFEVVKLFLGVGGEGANPTAPVIEGRDGALYGTTQNGGSGQNGTVYKVNKDGTGFQVLVSFPPLEGFGGTSPKPGIIEASDGALYGIFTYDLACQDAGTVFRVNKDGSGYKKLATLSKPSWVTCPGVPYGLLEGSDGRLYGTFGVGATVEGAIFRLNKDGTGYTVLTPESVSTEVVPTAALVEGLDGALYGPSVDTLYKIDKDGTDLLELKRFGWDFGHPVPSDAGEGYEPMGALLRGSDGAFYGTTYRTGGKVNDGDRWAEGYGTVYRLAVNHAPGVTRPIPDQLAAIGFPFSYTFPADTFSDVDTSQSLTYTVDRLWSGISFDPVSRTFSGTPTNCCGGRIQLVATDSGNPALSATNTFNLSVRPPSAPQISRQPQSQTLTNGAVARFLVIAAGTEPLYYQWFEGKAGDKSRAVAGATAATFTTQALTNSTAYWVQVTNAVGAANSQTATVTIKGLTPPTVTVQPKSQSVPSGNPVNLTVVATGTDPLVYQWYAGQTGDKGRPIVGATSASLTTPELTAESPFWVEVSNAGGVAQSITATITIAPLTAPEIRQMPFLLQIPSGLQVPLEVVAVGAKPISYQWYRRGNSETSVPVPGATNAALVTGPITVPTAFWVRVSNAGGSVDSSEALVIPSSPVSGSPNITFQPIDRTVKPDETAQLSVVATGSAPLKYQWYFGESGDKSRPVTGATSFVYDVRRPTKTTSYWVQVTNALGVADSQTAMISVVAPPTITRQPQSQTISSGSAVALEVAATGTEPLAFHWFEGQRGDMSRPLPGASAASFTSPALTNTTTYWVQVTNALGHANSEVATITVSALVPPEITQEPQSLTVTNGGPAILVVVAMGTEPLAYQWYSGASGDTSNPVASATEAIFTTPTLSTSTVYWVQVTNAVGFANSQTATITVVTPLVITVQPLSQTITNGGMATLTVVATGTEPFGYQWYVGESGDMTALVPGAAAASFTTPVLTNTTAYWVRVINVAGVVNSQTATITIEQPTQDAILHVEEMEDNKLRLRVTASSGTRWRVQQSADLVHWESTQNIAPVEIVDGQAVFEISIGLGSAGFYRLAKEE